MNKPNYEIIERDNVKLLVLEGIASQMFVVGLHAPERWGHHVLSSSDFGALLQIDTLPGKIRVELTGAHASCSMTVHDDSRLKKLRSTRLTGYLSQRAMSTPDGYWPSHYPLEDYVHSRSLANAAVIMWSDRFARLCGPMIEIPIGVNSPNETRWSRKKPKPSRLEMSSAVRIATTPELFRSLLNASAKGGLFCVAADRGRYAVFNGEHPSSIDKFPKLKKKYKISSVVDGEGSAGTYYKILYDTLYRRKQGCLGMLTTLERLLLHEGEEAPEFSFGLSTDNRLFVELSTNTWSYRICFNNLYGVPKLQELPELTVMGHSRKQVEPNVEASIKVLTLLSSDEEAIVSQWKTSSDNYRDARNVERTENRKLMFTDHVLVLAMSGRGPSDEELDLLRRL